MTDEPPDYMGMNGAEFQRAVGTDPEKWAEAFEQRMGRAVADSEFTLSASREARVAYMVGWFRDAMEAAVRHAVAPRWDQQYSIEDLEAAVKAAQPPSVDWDGLRDRLNVTLSEHGLPNMRKPSE